MSTKDGDRSDKWPQWARKAPDWRAALRRPLSFPLGRAHLADGGAAPPQAFRLGVNYDTEWARRYPVRLARAAWTEIVTRPVMAAVAQPTVDRPGPPRPHSRARHLRLQPLQPPRHAPGPVRAPGQVAPQDRHPGRRRLFLRHPFEGGLFRLLAQRCPHRAQPGEPGLGRPGRGTAERGLEPAHLPRGRPQPRRLGPGAPGRRGVAGRPQRPSPRTPAYRRHGPPVAPRRQAHIHRQDQRDLRGARVPGPARPPAGRPSRGGHRRPRRRGRHGLVVGPVEGGGRDHPGTDRS